MEVLVFGYSFTIGGVENYLQNMNSILPQETRFHFIVEKQVEQNEEKGISGSSYTLVPNARSNLRDYMTSIETILLNKKGKVKTVYVNISDFKIENYVVIKLANKYNYKIVTHAHAAMGNEIIGITHKLIHKYICYRCKSIVKKKSNKRLAVSSRAGKYLYNELPFKVVSPGIDVERYRFNFRKRNRIRKELNLSSEFVIGFVGRIVSVKNPTFAIKILQNVLKKEGYTNTKLLIVGDGPERDSLMKMITEYKLDKYVILVGQVKNVEDYLSVMDCLIGTSFSEGLPLNILEAMASGLFCVCAEGNYPEELKQFDRFSTEKLGDNYLDKWVDLIISMNNRCFCREEGYKTVVSNGYDQSSICSNLIRLLY